MANKAWLGTMAKAIEDGAKMQPAGGFFDTVDWGFLPPGHSHDDYDTAGAEAAPWLLETGSLAPAGLTRKLAEMPKSCAAEAPDSSDYTAWVLSGQAGPVCFTPLTFHTS